MLNASILPKIIIPTIIPSIPRISANILNALLLSQVSKLIISNQIPMNIIPSPVIMSRVKMLIMGNAMINKPRIIARIPDKTLFPAINLPPNFITSPLSKNIYYNIYCFILSDIY